MCLYNRMMINRKYTKTAKNGGIVPPLPDERVRMIPIGCGNCIECRKEKQREWLVRLMEDIKHNEGAKFVAFTLSNESIKEICDMTIERRKKNNPNEKEMETIRIGDLTGYDKDNTIATKAVRMFLERWRKKYKKSLRHWLITELGHRGTENIHIHGIVWPEVEGTWEEIAKTMTEKWQYGWTFMGKRRGDKLENYVNQRSIGYITKYVSKRDEKHKEYKAIILSSAGIGGKYTETKNAKRNEYKGKETNETYKSSTGHEIKIPIYWRNKLYTEQEKEDLWLHKLNKMERWVCGERVDISKGEEEYTELVQWHRRRNIELGYGGLPNENRKEYEEQMREQNIATRIRMAMNTIRTGKE